MGLKKETLKDQWEEKEQGKESFFGPILFGEREIPIQVQAGFF